MKLYRSFFTVGGLTMLSRVLGFVRDIMFARVMGTGLVADAFVVAFRFPNLFRRLFGEGAFNSAFVPLFAKRLEGDGPDEARAFASEAMSGLTFVLVLISALCMIAMPLLMYVLAPGFADSPDKFNLAIDMSRIAFPYMLCMSLVALLSGVLNSVGRFAESSSVSIVLNLTLIGALLAAAFMGLSASREAGIVIAWGIFAAGILQLLVLVIGAARIGLLPRLQRPRMTEGVRKLVALGVPGVIAGGITQINIVIGGMVASLQDGAVSYLYYADRLYELPLAIIGIAIGVVLLPDISRHLRAGNHAAVMDSQNRSLEFALLLTVPAAVALAVVPREIVAVLFERGAFRPADSANVANALTFFALGLPAFVMIKVFSPAFFAREDTRTPMRIAAWSLAINTAGSAALFFLLKSLGHPPHVGIAIATAIGGWINAIWLWRELAKAGFFAADARFRRALPLILLSSAAMGVALWIGAGQLSPHFQTGVSLFNRAAALAVLLGGGGLAYAIAVIGTGAIEIGQLKRLVRRTG